MANRMMESLCQRTGKSPKLLRDVWFECKTTLLEDVSLEDEDFYDKLIEKFKTKVGLLTQNESLSHILESIRPEGRVLNKLRDIRS